jgi:ABC-type transporter MlaC component
MIYIKKQQQKEQLNNMKKYVFTENQIKKIIDSQINEQTAESYEGVIKTINGKTIVIATSEMGNTKQIPVKLKVNVPDGTGVFVSMKNGQPEIWGGKPNRKLN